ncbi:hypothetical protein LXT21_36330 [Myxococcus sp. K38C18041901]|uniref:hypothetical protein n=1 Tax=Myxococcus guangdongensis TaxID=2906760 RepID=UPI0020A792C4|nr:hypothetical protein [Myxococcus guangdongensis]MCP3064256.1 hypothetical protein [Myxococcus guangdongensis]
MGSPLATTPRLRASALVMLLCAWGASAETPVAQQPPPKRRPDAISPPKPGARRERVASDILAEKTPTRPKPPATRTRIVIPAADVPSFGVKTALELDVVSPFQASYVLEDPGTEGVKVKLTLPATVPGASKLDVQHANVRGLGLYIPALFQSLKTLESGYRLTADATARIERVGESCLWVEDPKDITHPYQVDCMYSASPTSPSFLCTFSSLNRNLARAALETCQSLTMR